MKTALVVAFALAAAVVAPAGAQDNAVPPGFVPAGFVPASKSAVDPEAAASALRPGDVISIRVPGEEAFAKTFQIGRDGRVNLPQIGATKLAGLGLDAAKARLRQALGRFFRDLDTFDVMLEDRRLLVTVQGFVKTPGPVELPAEATIQAALAAAGGLAPGAQLDRMQLRRAGKSETFDYKSYLDKGDPALLPALQTLDTVFVPASPLIGNVQVEFDAQTLKAAGDAAEDGKAVRVFGEVRSPGSFAFKPGMNVVDMIMRAGGVTQFAAVEQIRIIAGSDPVQFNLKDYLDIGNPKLLPSFGPGATIFVPRTSDGIKSGAQIVYVMGEVFKPGPFETKNALGFLDILANAGGPTRYADTRQIRVMRAGGSVERVDLQKFTESGSSKGLPKISPGDAIFVPEKPDQKEPSWLKVGPDRAVYVMGAVPRPGRYEYSAEMSLLDVLAQAGGPGARADVTHLQISLKGEGQKPTIFDLQGYLKGTSRAALPRVVAGTTIMVPELPDDPRDNKSQWTRQASDRSIYVMGAVQAPGRYAFSPDFSFLDILAAADGPSPAADLRNIRVSHRNGAETSVSKVNLALFFDTGDDRALPRVKPGDVIFVPSRNGDWMDQSKENTIRVLGAVGKPGRYTFEDSMTILDLLAEAGGPTGNAYQEKIVVVNLSCCKEQAQVFDLVGFAKTGDFSKLPVIRPGDTVYVPDQSQNGWNSFMATVRDIVQVLSVVALIGAL
ncbi:MAG: SLBB domain-containing protein [Alphaproteobacteria bacterium]|nr:SLBB domain-containing protein [Alphaproteobacteria bacterium]